ncbi:hypothetical protein PS876_01501 [Pseudomonas fluorescens]|nr:hypothetical protein PS876_01501 [Pseudomonas fluorescens]
MIVSTSRDSGHLSVMIIGSGSVLVRGVSKCHMSGRPEDGSSQSS